MGHNHSDVNLGFCSPHYPQGTHMCLIYNDEEERRTLVKQYLESGLQSGELVGYFAMGKNLDQVKKWLDLHDIPPSLIISEAMHTYCSDGTFQPKRMLQNLRNFYSDAVQKNHHACRVSGEMGWALQPVPGTERLIEYEVLVNLVLKTHPVTAICQYDASLFDADLLSHVIEVHPMIIVNGQVAVNRFYRQPEEFPFKLE